MFRLSPKLAEQFQIMATRFGKVAGEIAVPLAAARAGEGLPPEKDPFQEAYDRLNSELRELDRILQEALRRNTILFWVRFGLVFVLALAVLGATCILIGRQVYVWGGVAGVVDLALIGWFLNEFRRLQDERFNLIFRVAAYRPRLATARTLSELDQLAREVEASLRFVSGATPHPAVGS